MSRESTVWIASIALLAAGSSHVALADDALAEPTAEARSFFGAGRQAFAAGSYDVAAAAFEASYRLLSDPDIAFSAAQAHRLHYFVDQDGRRLERARDLYRTYLERRPTGGRRRDAIEHLATIEQILLAAREPSPDETETEQRTELLISSATDGAAASLDGSAFRELPAVVRLAPGSHRIRFRAAGHEPAERSVVAVDGRLVHVQVDLAPLPGRLSVTGPEGAHVLLDGRRLGQAPIRSAAVLEPGEHLVEVVARGHHPFRRRIIAGPARLVRLDPTLGTTRQRVSSRIVLGAAGGFLAGAATTTVLAVLADRRAADAYGEVIVDHRRNFTEAELDDYRSSRELRDELSVISYGMAAGAVALGVTGLLLHWLDMPSPWDGPSRDRSEHAP